MEAQKPYITYGHQLRLALYVESILQTYFYIWFQSDNKTFLQNQLSRIEWLQTVAHTIIFWMGYVCKNRVLTFLILI